MTVHFGYFFSSIKLHQRNGRGLGNMAISGCRDLSGNGMTHLLMQGPGTERREEEERRRRGHRRGRGERRVVDGAAAAPRDLRTHSNQQAILRSHKNKAQKLSDDLKNIRATPLHHSYHVQ